MDSFVETLAWDPASRPGLSDVAKELDTPVEAFRTRPPFDAGPYTFVAADAPGAQGPWSRPGGRRARADRGRGSTLRLPGGCLGVDATTAEDGAGWLTFLRSLTARGLSGVKLVTSDAHAGLLTRSAPRRASWQRCRTHSRHQFDGHHPEELMAVSAYAVCTRYTTSPTLIPLQRRYDRIVDALTDKLPKVAEHLDAARPDLLAFHRIS